jgi:hypothetical protein
MRLETFTEFASQSRILLDIRHDPPMLSIQSKC